MDDLLPEVYCRTRKPGYMTPLTVPPRGMPGGNRLGDPVVFAWMSDGRGWLADDPRSAIAALLPRLRRFALALTGSATDADELVQATCERVLSRADQLRDHARLDAWVYGIMRNMWIDEVRSRKLRRHDELSAASEVIGTDGHAVAEGRITLAMVRRMLAQLSQEQRAVLMLVCVDGLTYKETAAVLSVPLGTVMSRLSRARQELHARMQAPSGSNDGVTAFPGRSARGVTRPE